MKQVSIFYFVVFALFSSVSIDCENGYDAVFDSVLKKFNDQFKAQKLCEKELQDVSMTIKHKVWIFPVHVHVTATKGNVKDLCTFKRSGDVKITPTDKSTVTISLGIDMDNLEIDYGDVKAKASIFYNHNFGSLGAVVKQHSVQGQLTLSMPSTNSCNINLDFVKITSLGDIHVYLNGKENSQFDKLADGDINSLKQTASSTIESKIKAILKSEDVCKEILAAGITVQ